MNFDTYAVLVGMSGNINFCECCGKTFNIPNWHNKKTIPFKHSDKIRVDLMDYDRNQGSLDCKLKNMLKDYMIERM